MGFNSAFKGLSNSVTKLRLCYNNLNTQLHATITDFIDNYNELFVIISIDNYTDLIVIINKNLLFMHLVGCVYYCISDARSHRHQTQTVLV